MEGKLSAGQIHGRMLFNQSSQGGTIMRKFLSVLRTAGALAFALLIGLSAIAGAQEVPITTKSDEARKIFLDGLRMSDNFRNVEARELFAKAIEKDPDFALAHLYRSFTSTSAMDFQEHLKHAVALGSKASEGERVMIEAVQASAENNPVKQVQLWEQLVQKFPRDKHAQLYLAFAYSGRDEDDKAIAGFEKAIEIDKDFAPAYNALGYAYREKGNYVKAEEAFTSYIRLLPNEANPYDSLADLYTKMGRHEDAIVNYKKAVELNPKFVISQANIGTNLVLLGKYEEGREAYRKAMTMEATPSAKLTDMDKIARSYVYESKHQLALAEGEKLLQMATTESLPEWQAGSLSTNCSIYTETGDLAKAEQSLAKCKKVVMGSELSAATKEKFAKTALSHDARIAAKRNDFAKAMTMAEEYKAKIDAGKDPKEMENYHALLGRIHSEKGDYAKAIEHLKQANQENPYTLYLLAVAESKAGDDARAAELYKKVANWNEDSLGYAFVRSKAMTAMKVAVIN